MDQQTKLVEFYTSLQEPIGGTLMFLRQHILNLHPKMNESRKYGMPFFCFGKKMFCYFWFDKQDKARPYIGFAEGHRMQHRLLEKGSRKRMKIFRIAPDQDLPMNELNHLFKQALTFY